MAKNKVVETQIKTKPGYRFFQLDRAQLDEENRTVPLAFSSEAPYERYFGTEILDHGKSSIRLDRLNGGAAVLLNHDTDRHVGVVEQVSIGPDRIGRAVVRFGKSAIAEEAFNDVKDGIKKHVSVGYFIHRMVLESEEENHETYRITDWEPFEISVVPIPADPTVGVGRSAPQEVTTAVVRSAQEPAPQPVQVIQPKELKMSQVIENKAGDQESEKARRDTIVALGDGYKKYVSDKDVLTHVMNGASADQFREFIMKKMETSHTDVSTLAIGMTKQEKQRYSLLRAINAALSGDWSQAGLERACSQAVAKMTKATPEGFFVPYDAWNRDFNVGTAAEAGNLVATDLRTDLYTDVLRNALVMVGLGQRVLTGLSSNIDIPRKTVKSAISRVTEIAALTETQPTTAKVSLVPKRFGGFVEYSKQALIQGSMSIEEMLKDDLLKSAAEDIQDQCINGSGTAPNMRGIRNTSGVGSVVGGTNGLAIAWTHIVGLESACANVNAEPDQMSGYLINTKSRGTTKTVQKATNLPFIWDNGAQPLNGYRAAVSNSVPSNLTKGTSNGVCSSLIFSSDWSMSVLALFGAPDIVVDPFSLATTGQVRITLNQFGDHGLRLPASFAVMDDALTP